MSDTGLNANTYYLTSKYLELVNDFLIAIQGGGENLSSEMLNEVQDLVKKLQDEDIIDTRIQTLSIIIESELRGKKITPIGFYSSLNENLSNKKYDAVAKNLNHVIVALDNEYTHALAKMKEM